MNKRKRESDTDNTKENVFNRLKNYFNKTFGPLENLFQKKKIDEENVVNNSNIIISNDILPSPLKKRKIVKPKTPITPKYEKVSLLNTSITNDNNTAIVNNVYQPQFDNVQQHIQPQADVSFQESYQVQSNQIQEDTNLLENSYHLSQPNDSITTPKTTIHYPLSTSSTIYTPNDLLNRKRMKRLNGISGLTTSAIKQRNNLIKTTTPNSYVDRVLKRRHIRSMREKEHVNVII